MTNLVGEQPPAPIGTRRVVEPKRRGRRSRGARLSAGHLVMVIAGLLGALLSLAVLRASDHRIEVAVAAHELPANSVFTANDVRWTRVAIDHDVERSLVHRSDLDALDGSIASVRVRAGALIGRRDLVHAAAPHRLRSLGIPVTPEHAVGGDLQSGDRVDVLSTDSEHPGITVANLQVLDVKHQSSALSSGDDKLTVVVALSASDADALATVLGSDKFVLVLATGADRVAASTQRGSDVGG